MYSQNHNSDALKLFNAMLASGITPSHFILNCTFKACTSIQDTQLLHDYVIRNEFETDYIIGSSLVDMYVKLGDLNAAHRVFDKLVKHDIVSWGALIDGYARHNHGSTALALYCRMLEGNIKPDKAIFLSILEGCAQIQDIGKGRELHHVIIRNGFHNDITITSALVKLYAMCGSLEEAHKQFDTALEWDVVSLGALIAGYIQHGLYDAVIELVMEMQEENMEPDEAILLSLLKAYGGLGDIKMGWTIHDYFLKREIVRDRDLGNVLIDMYVGCGRLKEARRVFDILSARNEVSWGAMIAGYVQEGDSFTAFQLLHEMLNCQLKPDGIIYLSILKACIIMGAVMKGMLIHDQLIRDGFDADAVLSNMLLHMYASCKSLDEAQKVFKLMQRKDVVSWSALITGLASSGLCRQAEDTLMDMLYHGLQPDDTVFTIVLSSYVHNGSLMDGLLFYRRTRQGHPTLAHVNCLLDLFGRTGRLAEARELSRAMPFSVDMITHTTLLTNSKKFGDVHLGRHCFKQAAESNEERALYHLYNEVL
ncbi:hypothetical protein KP509_13G094600 [Ceratopteris richardii]|uniref:Pentatricopeptide repeat-containing protein n=1 Tax=Ceratopteris richardii TaxID=49495 RepID=A0A8T2TKA7_CERRI|nr:hypothetical protein KP509_13G094600 [Ceratopteris richardii]KAH7422175.1 hypothetical protein KP509_13G094600 [Ceratopteris richardii]KAH7422176.1 hypothetical protein KP509_13G094600 [Ceratopteris richardii]